MSNSLTIAAVDGFPVMDVEQVSVPTRYAAPEIDWNRLEREAALISTHPALPEQFQEPEQCRFVAYKAQRWGTDPIATAEKTYFTPRKGGGWNVGYEAQLIHAVVQGSPELLEPLDISFGYSDPAKKNAANRFCKVAGIVRGARKALTITTPTIGQIKTKHSAMWWSDPDQALAYYGVRAWARRHMPARIMGAYSRDELDSMHTVERIAGPPMFEEDDTAEADFGDAIPPGANDTPPDQSDHKPEDLDAVKAWAHGQRDAILAMTDPRAVADAGNAMLADPRFGRLKAYELATAKAIDRSVGGHIKELQG